MKQSTTASPAESGFTLLEVLVALAVLAIALGALVKAGADQADTIAHLRERTLAQWVAADQMARLRVETDWPETGTQRGISAMGRRDWYWTLEVSDTEVADIRRARVRVYADSSARHSLVTLSGFFGRY